MASASDGPPRTVTVCEICVRGELDPHWASWFDGLYVERDGPDKTVISGSVADQAALHGLLTRIRDLGLPLIWLQTSEYRAANRDVGKAPAG